MGLRQTQDGLTPRREIREPGCGGSRANKVFQARDVVSWVKVPQGPRNMRTGQFGVRVTHKTAVTAEELFV